MAMGLKDTTLQENYIENNYIALPGNIEKQVYNLTASVIKGNKNDYDEALAIKAYLVKNYNYTLSPSIPPEGSDFVSYFIDHDPNGYCTYFASAMAIMARIAGIPSRYVEGYLLPDKEPGSSVYVVRGKNAHAWAELYFEGIGWIPFDATPSGEGLVTGSGNNSGGVEPFPTPPNPTATLSDNSTDLGNGGFSWDHIVAFLWLTPAVAAAIALLWFLVMILRAKIRTSPGNIYRKYGDKRRQYAFYYFELLRLLEYYNYPVKKGETPYAYAARIDRWLRLESGTFTEVANLIALISYSDYKPTEKDVDFISRFRRDLAKYTYQTVGPLYYLWHQVLGFGKRSTGHPPAN
jgi:hypothetical protein